MPPAKVRAFFLIFFLTLYRRVPHILHWGHAFMQVEGWVHLYLILHIALVHIFSHSEDGAHSKKGGWGKYYVFPFCIHALVPSPCIAYTYIFLG